MESETMVNSMGGSMKENMYKGGPWAPEEILRKGLAVTCLLPQVAAVTSVALVPDPWVQLEPKQVQNRQHLLC